MPAFSNCQRFEFDNAATISGHYFRMAAPRKFVTIAGKRIPVSNLEKILYPGEKFTKAKVIEYYVQISKYLLPHLKRRPVTLKRYPEGVFGEAFYEKDAPAFTPAWVKTAPVPRRETPGGDIRYILINDLPTLVWVANLGALELHPFCIAHRDWTVRPPWSSIAIPAREPTSSTALVLR